MSLISNTDYLIHSLRMNYLRNIEDPYGPRLISLGPSYHTNPHILASSMADVDQWPELAMPSSPPPSDTEDDNKDSGQPNFGATGLKYSTTITGGRTGGLGMRVDGKRYSASKRMSGSGSVGGSTPRNPNRRMFNRVNEELELPGNGDGDEEGEVKVKVQVPTVVEEAPVQKTVQFIPKFKHAAEMEARRRERMMARRGVQNVPAPPVVVQPAKPLSWDTSSDEDEVAGGNSSEEEQGFSDDGQGSIDDVDEFDPEFAATRTPGAPSSSLNPVISPLSPTRSSSHRRARQSPTTNTTRPSARGITRSSSTRSATLPSSSTSTSTPTTAPAPLFPRRPTPPLPPSKPSLLSLLLSSQSLASSSNPFTEHYGAISGRGAPPNQAITIKVPP